MADITLLNNFTPTGVDGINYGASYKICIKKEFCYPYKDTPFFKSSIEETNGCNPCGTYYQIKIPQGQTMDFQTLFENENNDTDPNLSMGWYNDGMNNSEYYVRAYLYALDGTLVSDNIEDFAPLHYVAKDGTDYQVLRLNTDTPIFNDLKCFYIVVKSFISGQESYVAYSEQISIVDEKFCDKLLKVNAIRPSRDCYRHFYNTPSLFYGRYFEYDPSIYVEAEFFDTGYSSQQTVNRNTSIVKNDIRELFSLVFYQEIPKFMADYLYKVIYNSQRVIVNDDEYIPAGDDITRFKHASYLPNLGFYKFCESSNC
jgi:hypothetical protein